MSADEFTVAFLSGAAVTYVFVGALIGAILPVKRRVASIAFCAFCWPLMLVDIDFKPNHRTPSPE